MWTSVPQIPARRTRISTSFIPGFGASISSSHNPGSRLLLTRAFIQSYCLIMKATLLLLSCAAAYAQFSEQATWATQAQNRYVIKPNITYGIQNNYETKLDVYQRRDATGPQPTIVYIHGGGWTGGSKETSVMALFPYFEMGWNVVNVEYRLEKISPAPAAVED